MPVSLFPVYGSKVLVDEFGWRVVLGGCQGYRGRLQRLGGQGDEGDVNILAWEAAVAGVLPSEEIKITGSPSWPFGR
jgi:hypothetical protein